MIQSTVPDSTSALHNVTHATRDVESEVDAAQGGRMREIAVDNAVDPMVSCTDLCLLVI